MAEIYAQVMKAGAASVTPPAIEMLGSRVNYFEVVVVASVADLSANIVFGTSIDPANAYRAGGSLAQFVTATSAPGFSFAAATGILTILNTPIGRSVQLVQGALLPRYASVTYNYVSGGGADVSVTVNYWSYR